MFNIFTAKKGKHNAKRFTAKYRRALVAAAIVTSALLTSVSAAMIMSRDTLTAVSAGVKDGAGSTAAEISTSENHAIAMWRSKILQSTLQNEDSDRAAEVRSEDSADIRTRSVAERLSRALRSIAMSRAVREELSEHSTVAYADQAVTVFTPKGQFPGQTRLEDGVTLVDAIAFARFVGDCDISRDGDTVYMKGSAYDVSIPLGSEYLISSGRVFWARRTHTTDGDVVFVPLDTLSRAFGLDCATDSESYAVRLSASGAVIPGESFYREDEVYWLSRIIQAESRGECLAGKIAVGNVVLNRVRDKRFPNTIYGVIFDRSCGVQFTPSVNGTIHLEPSEESVIAAKICLEGYSVSDEITFFFNPAISQNTWISDNRQWVCTIGNHAFYS